MILLVQSAGLRTRKLHYTLHVINRACLPRDEANQRTHVIKGKRLQPTRN